MIQACVGYFVYFKTRLVSFGPVLAAQRLNILFSAGFCSMKPEHGCVTNVL